MKSPWFETATTWSWGKARFVASTSSSTRRATSTVFASACLRIATRVPSSPFTRTWRVSFWKVSSTFARSPIMTAPFAVSATTVSRISSRLANSAGARSVTSIGPSSSLPAGRSRFALRSASSTCDIGIPSASRRAGSSSTRTSRG